MPRYVIEREIPNVGKLSSAELQGISQKSCNVLQNLGPQIQWLESYVTDDKLYCVYIAPDEKLVKEHARQGGFPADRISEVKSVIDPTTAEANYRNYSPTGCRASKPPAGTRTVDCQPGCQRSCAVR